MSVETFEIVLNNSRETWLNDHRIGGKCIFPAAGYIELLLANLDLLDRVGSEGVGIGFEKFKIVSPLIFAAGEDKRIEIELPLVDSAELFRVKTKKADGSWDVHVEGYLKSFGKEKVQVQRIEEIRSRCSRRLDGAQFYSLYSQARVEYGPFFRSVKDIRWNETEFISGLALEAPAAGEENCFFLHPAFLDGAFQSVGIFPFFAEEKVLYLPFYIDHILIHGSLPDRCFCYGKAVKGAGAASGLLKFDIVFCDEQGQVLVEIKDFCLKSLPARHPAAEGKRISPERNYRSEDVAIIGMAGRFPGAADLEEFWQNLANGRAAVTEIPNDRWDIEQYFDEDADAPGKTNCRHGCFLEEIDRFDPMFFGISVNKAKYIDPQQRLMLETAFHAVEDAGCGGNLLSKTRTGVYIGVSHNEYIHRGDPGSHQVSPHIASGNTFSAIANRISYLLDLTGPSIAVDAACSSSLVALYYAVQDIIRGECEYALAGGINLTLSPATHIIFSKLQVLSPDGACRPFDRRANGYIRGEGVGAVLLKSLPRAIADRDNIHAVIKGISVGHTGTTNGFNSPSSISETSVIQDAFRQAGIDPESVAYVESHGTGTALGDRIEFRGLAAAFKKFTTKRGFCALGSVKANIGHLESAAGIASVIKTVLALKKQKIPPMLHFSAPNEKIDFNQSPFFVNDRLRDWQSQTGPRRAGVSTFGFGGTNVHLILEEFSAAPKESAGRKHTPLLTLSAKSSAAVENVIAQMIDALGANPGSDLYDICATYNSGRSHHDKFRMAVLAANREEMIEKLSAYLQERRILDGVFVSEEMTGKGKVAFLFADAYPSLDRGSFSGGPLFEEHLRELETRVKQVGVQTADLLHGLALVHVLEAYGIKAQVVGGIGKGEIAAAIVSGCLRLEDASRWLAGSDMRLEASRLKIPFLQESGGSFLIRPAFAAESAPLQTGQDYSLDSARSWLEKNGFSLVVEPAAIRSLHDLNELAARAYALGVDIDWHGYYRGDPFHRVSLPTYPFKRTRYWMDD